jgi:guanylate kinase
MNKNFKQSLLVALVGASGAGKSTLVKLVLSIFQILQPRLSVSCTTRESRPGEVNGVDYHFISEKDFLKMKEKGLFAETSHHMGNYYGTLKSEIEFLNALTIVDVEVDGARALKKLYPDMVTIFVKPPSVRELRNRLSSRGSLSEDKIDQRIARYTNYEILFAKEADYVVVNDILLNAFSDVCSIIFQELGGEITAMDGSAASGKGYLSEEVAKAKNAYLLPSGILYRYIAYSLFSYERFDQTDLDEIIQEFKESYLDELKDTLQESFIGIEAAKLAKLQMVRDACRILQMKLAYGNHGKSAIVAEGRDMTTEVFRLAKCKFYIDAKLEIRAQRRKEQRNDSRLLTAIIAELDKRDNDDMTRELSPLFFDEKNGVVFVDNSGTAKESLNIIFQRLAV